MAAFDIPVLGPVINKIFGTRNERIVKKLNQRVDAVGDLEPEMRRLTDAQLKAKTPEFRERLESGEKDSDLLVEAFAVAREAMDRNVGIRNIFNPDHRAAFRKDELSASMQKVYDETLAAMDAAEPLPPEGDLLGCDGPVPGWVWMDIPVELYEAVRAVYPKSKPPFRARPFDVQLFGGVVLFQGKIAEMKTGEGKTIVAPLAAYLAALDGHKVHVVTANDYLVQRDRDWTFPFFRSVGFTVGAIHPQHTQPEDQKRAVYNCDVVYGTTSEFGFDYLRDNMKKSAEQQVQRYREFAIVDEVDSILIDEARTPLIISGPAHEEQPRYDLADQLARHLVEINASYQAADDQVEACKRRVKGIEGDIRNAKDRAAVPALQQQLQDAKAELPRLEAARDQHTQYYEIERDKKVAHLTHHGVEGAQKRADIGSFYVGGNVDLPHLLENAIKAHVIYERDKDYAVMNSPDPMGGPPSPDVVIIDESTGRPMFGRQWSYGIHQAVQCKEGLRIKPETQTVASVTIQNFFKMYKRLAGMTGTADTEAQEFYDIYKLDVVQIPTNVPVVRGDHNDLVYLSAKDKWDAIVDEIKAFHDIGLPVLVGTTSVEKSEMLSRMLKQKHSIEHQVLNAKQHDRESELIKDAGDLGAVMIATNMAGRGTDIKLAPIPREKFVDHLKRRAIAPRDLSPQDDDAALVEKVYRKVAPKELDIPKREAESMDFAHLELRLLRHWADLYTWEDPAKLEKIDDPEELRVLIDQYGRFALHRLRWVETIEELGGLHVVGTERHESRRIDNQLRGRSGRQGDHGSTRFFVSLEDDLMKLFAGETTMKILSRMGMKEGDAIEHPMLSKSIVRAQRKVEERNFQIRKNILEYDEVMEAQRQDFYGLRQRVLDGRDTKGIIFDFVESSAEEAVTRYLDSGYAADRIAEFASDKLGTSIPAERVRGREIEDLEPTLKRVAHEEARHEIEITIGEYIPETESGGKPDLVDIDTKGLQGWADERFGVTLTSEEVDELSVKQICEKLRDAADARIEAIDLSELSQYLEPNYNARELSGWIERNLDLKVPVQEITSLERQEDVVDLVVSKVRERYDAREVDYPVDFQMDMTMALMQQAPAEAGKRLVHWANRRYGLGWEESVLRRKMPQQLRDELLAKSRELVESGRLEQEIAEAQAVEKWEPLVAHFRDRYDHELPLWMKRLKGDDRADAIRARVELILRAELVQFEQFVLLEVLDPTWRQHLYDMEKLRETIGYRAFSQQDPRIEYKREGGRLYAEMLETVHDRVTGYVFKLKLRPQLAPAGRQAPPRVAPGAGQRRPAPTPGAGGQAPTGFGGSMITGPGFGTPPSQ
ncbi:MAG: preprotein translocase subunit SecA [Planctomycetota bacterium]